MAPLEVLVRINASDTFQAEVEEDETVESLAVIIYSLRPDLGEELRLVHKGRLLKPDQVLAEVGFKSGDAVAVAKQPPRSAPATAAAAAPVPDSQPAAQQAAPQVVAVAEVHQAPAAAKASPPAVESAVVGSPTVQTLAPVFETAKSCTAAPMESSGPQDAAPAEAPSALASATAEEAETQAADVAAKVACEASPAVEPAAVANDQVADMSDDTPCDGHLAKKARVAEGDDTPADQLPASAAAETTDSKDDTIEVDASSADGLLEFARLLDNGGSPPSPEKLAVAMRQTAEKIKSLEGAVQDFAQALHMVNMVSVSTLREHLSKISGNASDQSSPDAHPASQQESTRSFLIKKGDADVQEMHRAAAALRPASGSTSSGGTLSSSTPLSKEEMMKARSARLAMLEAQQAEKQREREEAEERGKAREALFNRPFAGSAKPLGKP